MFCFDLKMLNIVFIIKIGQVYCYTHKKISVFTKNKKSLKKLLKQLWNEFIELSTFT